MLRDNRSLYLLASQSVVGSIQLESGRKAMSGYTFSIGPRHYDAWKDGKPFSLVEILYEIDGVGGVTVYRPNGSTLLDNAGSELARRDYVRRQKRERWDRLYARRWRVAS